MVRFRIKTFENPQKNGQFFERISKNMFSIKKSVRTTETTLI